MKKLDGKTAIVTGASKEIGASIANHIWQPKCSPSSSPSELGGVKGNKG